MLFLIFLHLEEEVLVNLRHDIAVKRLGPVVIYLELGQAVLPQEVDESEGLLAPPPAHLCTLQVEVEETPEVVDLKKEDKISLYTIIVLSYTSRE